MRAGFGSKLAWLADREQEIVLIGRDDEDGRRAGQLAIAVGIRRLGGFLHGGHDELAAGAASGASASSGCGRATCPSAPRQMPSCRSSTSARSSEWDAGHIPGSVFTPWHDIDELPAGLDPAKPIAVICASGQRGGDRRQPGPALRRPTTSSTSSTAASRTWGRLGHPLERSAESATASAAPAQRRRRGLRHDPPRVRPRSALVHRLPRLHRRLQAGARRRARRLPHLGEVHRAGHVPGRAPVLLGDALQPLRRRAVRRGVPGHGAVPARGRDRRLRLRALHRLQGVHERLSRTTRCTSTRSPRRRPSATSARTGSMQGLKPSCEIVCPTQAIVSGDLDDPDSEISRLIDTEGEAAPPDRAVRLPSRSLTPASFLTTSERPKRAHPRGSARSASYFSPRRVDRKPQETCARPIPTDSVAASASSSSSWRRTPPQTCSQSSNTPSSAIEYRAWLPSLVRVTMPALCRIPRCFEMFCWLAPSAG